MYQFIHVESYSRTPPKSAKGTGKEGRSVRYIIDEAIRAEGAHPHIDQPKPPVILHGESPEALEDLCESWAASVTDARGRKTRKDALCLLAGVVSAPAEIGPERWETFKADTLDWLKKKYGSSLRSVIEHTDEAHPHLHFYAVPELGQRFETVHEGRLASAEAKAQGLKKGAQNSAYKAAMRDYQDQFFTDVAVKHGMARIGPGRRRLSRQEWQQEQQQVQAAATAIHLAEQTITSAEESAQGITDEARQTAQMERLEAIRKAKEEAKNLARKALEKADKIQLEAEKKGFQRGLDKVEQLPWFKRIAAVAYRAVRQRDELKKTLDQLITERDKLEEDKESLTARAKHYLKTGKSIQKRLKDLESELTLARQEAARVAELERENEKLSKEVSSAKSQVQHWSAIAESYMMREQEEIDRQALNERKPHKHKGFDNEYQP